MADSPGGCQSLRDIEEARRAIAAMSGIGLPRTRARLRGHVAENSPSPRDPVSEGPTHLQNNPGATRPCRVTCGGGFSWDARRAIPNPWLATKSKRLCTTNGKCVRLLAG